jgi:hypothetical protein
LIICDHSCGIQPPGGIRHLSYITVAGFEIVFHDPIFNEKAIGRQFDCLSQGVAGALLKP